MTTIIVICAILLVAFAIYGTVRKARGKAKSSCCGGPEVKTVKKVEDTDESHYPYRYELGIEGMHCSNCARTVENAINSMNGIWAGVELGRNRAIVRAKQEMTEDDFTKALQNTSYAVTAFETEGTLPCAASLLGRIGLDDWILSAE